MPQIILANNIGQPTGEIQAQTQKVQFTPVTVSGSGDVTQSKEIQSQPEQPKTLDQAVQAKEELKAEPKQQRTDKEAQEAERMNAIIRREKAMRAKTREYETELSKYKAQVQELEQIKQQELARQERLKTDPVGFLTEQGYTTDQITQALINQPGPESQLIKQLSDKIAKMEAAQQESIKRQQEESNANYQNALKTIDRNVEKLVNEKPDDFEAIRSSEAEKSVTAYIEKVWKAEGVILDTEEAAREIEDYLTEQALGLASMKKVQNKLKATQAPKAPAQQAAPVRSQTLTNNQKISTRPLSSRDRAILAFKRQLK